MAEARMLFQRGWQIVVLVELQEFLVNAGE